MVGTQALEFGYESTNLLLYQYFIADKKSTCNAGDPVQSLGQEDPWRRVWQHTLVFLPGESHGQRNLRAYCPGGHKELDTTEQLTLPASPQASSYLTSVSQILLLCKWQ